jgi:hypothetical protein
MKVERFDIKSCCGGSSLIFKTDRPLTPLHLQAFIKLGYKEAAHFTKAGILYVDNSDFTVTGPFGTDRLTVRCKPQNKECTKRINDLEVVLQKME